MSNIIECQSVSKRFGNKYAIDHLNLSLPSGKVIGILGENGAGRSTLFRLLTGLSSPEEGSIKILGQNLTSIEMLKLLIFPTERAGTTGSQSKQHFGLGGKIYSRLCTPRCRSAFIFNEHRY